LHGTLTSGAFTFGPSGDSQGACDPARLRIAGRLLEARGVQTIEARLELPDCPACGELTLVSAPREVRRAAALFRGHH
jgi:hypothetical protein